MFGTWLCVLSSAAADASADSQTGETQEAIAVEDLKSLEDPTILRRRVWLETEWNHYDDGSDNLEETLGALWAWGIGRNADWGVRLKIPYEWHFAGDAPGDADANGIGDLKLATGLAYRLSEDWRIGGGLELCMPTAEDGLGDDVWKLQEFGTVAWDATDWLSLTPSFEYNHSLAKEDGASPQNYLELYFPATVVLPARWSFTARYQLKVNFEQDDDVSQAVKFYLAKTLETVPLGFTISFEKPLGDSAKDFQINFALTYFF